MNANFGLLDPLAGRMRKAERRLALAERALRDLVAWRDSL
jgi:methylenetetrahydrofolate--tRNA-(uracil-5-)-methyltransferase